MVKNQDKTLGILTHVLAIFTGFIAPLIIYLIAKDKFTKDNAREALNWQITFILYMIISTILVIILVGFLMYAIFGVLNLIFCILAAVKASDGEVYTYPMTLRLL